MENQIKRLGSLKSLTTGNCGLSPKSQTPAFELKDGEVIFAGESCKKLSLQEIYNKADVVEVTKDGQTYKAIAIGSIELKPISLVTETVGA